MRKAASFLAAMMLVAGLALSCHEPQVTIRPGCRFRVSDDVTGLPIQGAKITVVTLYAAKDTIGKWEYTTDELGIAAMATILTARRKEAAAGRVSGQYDFIAALQAEDYRYYSLRITPGYVLVRLSRDFPVACL